MHAAAEPSSPAILLTGATALTIAASTLQSSSRAFNRVSRCVIMNGVGIHCTNISIGGRLVPPPTPLDAKEKLHIQEEVILA